MVPEMIPDPIFPARETDRLPPPDKTSWLASELLETRFPEPVWVIPGLLPEGLSVLAGRPKIGKSHLALQMAHAVGSGQPIAGRAVRRQPVLYLALEDSPRRLRDRIIAQRWEHNVDVRFCTSWPDLAADGGISLLQKEIDRFGYGLVVIDTLTRAARYDHSDIGESASLWGNLQRIALDNHAAILVVDHLRKSMSGAQDVVDDLLGSTAKAAVADALMGIYRERGSKLATLYITGRDVEETSMVLEWVGSAWVFRGTAEEFGMRESERRVLEALRDVGGTSTVRALAEFMGENPGTISRALGSLARRGLVTSRPAGRAIIFSAAEVGGVP